MIQLSTGSKQKEKILILSAGFLTFPQKFAVLWPSSIKEKKDQKYHLNSELFEKEKVFGDERIERFENKHLALVANFCRNFVTANKHLSDAMFWCFLSEREKCERKTFELLEKSLKLMIRCTIYVCLQFRTLSD